MAMLVACGLYVASMIRLVNLGGLLRRRDDKIRVAFRKHRNILWIPYYSHS
jgi:hypothetical protein